MSRARARAPRAAAARWISAGIITFSSAVNSGSRWWNWNTKPISRLRNSASRAGAHRRQVLAVEPDRARGREVERAEHVQERRLADARGADDRDHLAGLELEVEPAQHLDLRPPCSNRLVRPRTTTCAPVPADAVGPAADGESVVMGCAELVGDLAGVNDAIEPVAVRLGGLSPGLPGRRKYRAWAPVWRASPPLQGFMFWGIQEPRRARLRSRGRC